MIIMRVIIFCTLSMFSITSGLSQLKFSTELSISALYMDYSKSKEDFFGFFQGTATKGEAMLHTHFRVSNKINTSFGLGYMHLYYLDVWKTYLYRDYRQTSYLSAKVSGDFKFGRFPVLHLGMSNYLLAHQKKQQRIQRRYFANIDVGVKIKLSNHMKLNISSPFTVFPIYHGGPIGITTIGGRTGPFKPWIEMNGLVLGVQYLF